MPGHDLKVLAICPYMRARVAKFAGFVQSRRRFRSNLRIESVTKPASASCAETMPQYTFRRDEFDFIHVGSRNNDYQIFRDRDLDRRYGVYVFRQKSDDITLYVGRGGTGVSWSILARLRQHYEKQGKASGFWKNWCERTGSDRTPATRIQFLNLSRSWKIITLTTDEHSAVTLIPVIEAVLIHWLRPCYNKPYPDARTNPRDKALCGTFSWNLDDPASDFVTRITT